MKDMKELRQMDVSDLHQELLTLRKEQFGLRMKKANGALDKTHNVSIIRKAIARVKTIMTEKAVSNV